LEFLEETVVWDDFSEVAAVSFGESTQIVGKLAGFDFDFGDELRSPAGP
jgi:hypothetical protein